MSLLLSNLFIYFFECKKRKPHYADYDADPDVSYSDDDSDFVDDPSSLDSNENVTLLLPSPGGQVHEDPGCEEHKKAYYAAYTPMFKEVQYVTNLITQQKYKDTIKVSHQGILTKEES